MKKLVLVISFLLSVTSVAQAKEVYFGSGLETVRLTYGQSTIFRFSKQVRTVSQASRFDIKPADANDPDYSLLTVRPRFTKGSTKLVFILSDGSAVNLHLVMTKHKASVPAMYDFKPKSTLIERGDSEKNLPVVSEIDLMKAMVRDDEVTGYKRSTYSSWINSHFKGVSVSLKRVYVGKEYNGYVFAITNGRRKTGISLDVSKLTLGNPNLAVLSQIDNEILPKKGKITSSTTLRIVAKSSATYRDIKLPIVVHKNNSKKKK